MTHLFPLRNEIRHYPWGSTRAIPDLFGAKPNGRPWAELWMGDHRAAPSCALDAGVWRSLPEVIAAHPEAMMGLCAGRPQEGLPFLFKVLAAAAPLSIQVHPDAQRARDGFHREEDAGILADAPERIFRDPYAKPEMLCALSQFRLLCGFRSPTSVCNCMTRWGLDPMVVFGTDAASNRLSTVRAILHQSRSRCRQLVSMVLAAVKTVSTTDADSILASSVGDLADKYPDDPGVLLALWLQPAVLEPGEAVFIPPGCPHAYLSGMGLELMGASDNVVRAALTTKQVDIETFLTVVHDADGSAQRIIPFYSEAESVYDTPAFGLQLARIAVSDPVHTRGRAATPEILLNVAGSVNVSVGNDESVHLCAGDSVFVAASCAGYVLSGSGVVYRAGVRMPA